MPGEFAVIGFEAKHSDFWTDETENVWVHEPRCPECGKEGPYGKYCMDDGNGFCTGGHRTFTTPTTNFRAYYDALEDKQAPTMKIHYVKDVRDLEEMEGMWMSRPGGSGSGARWHRKIKLVEREPVLLYRQVGTDKDCLGIRLETGASLGDIQKAFETVSDVAKRLGISASIQVWSGMLEAFDGDEYVFPDTPRRLIPRKVG